MVNLDETSLYAGMEYGVFYICWQFPSAHIKKPYLDINVEFNINE